MSIEKKGIGTKIKGFVDKAGGPDKLLDSISNTSNKAANLYRNIKSAKNGDSSEYSVKIGQGSDMEDKKILGLTPVLFYGLLAGIAVLIILLVFFSRKNK